MSAPVIAFFNSKSRVGKTTLVYHLSWMYVELGLRVVAVDLDPQADLTAALLDEDSLEDLWPREYHSNTIFGCIDPLIRGVGDIEEPGLAQVGLDAQHSLFGSSLALLAGDLLLSSFEDDFSKAWFKCQDQDEQSFRVMSAFWRIIQRAATKHNADVVLIDVGPNLSAINRAALIAADFIVVPLALDLFSLQGLRTLGPALQEWRDEWKDRMTRNVISHMPIPTGDMHAVGYIALQRPNLLKRLTLAPNHWILYVPKEYRKYVLNEDGTNSTLAMINDPHCLASLRHYPSLMDIAQESHKPMFLLKPADGAVGADTKAVQDAYKDFRSLAQKIAQKTNIPLT